MVALNLPKLRKKSRAQMLPKIRKSSQILLKKRKSAQECSRCGIVLQNRKIAQRVPSAIGTGQATDWGEASLRWYTGTSRENMGTERETRGVGWNM